MPIETKEILKQANEILDKAVETMRTKRNEEDRRFIVSQIGKDLANILMPLLEKIAENSKTSRQELETILKEIKIESPQVQVEAPKVQVSIPEIKMPAIDTKGIIGAIKQAFSKITMPEPKVEVKVPEIKMPAMKDLILPKKMKVEGSVDLPNITAENPLPVILTDKDGNFYRAIMQAIGGGGGGSTTKDVRVMANSGIGVGNKAVATAGTAEQLSATSVPCKRVFIQAFDTNTDAMVIGDANVVAAAAGRKGLALLPNQGQWFNVNDLNLIYLDAISDGDSIAYLYEM